MARLGESIVSHNGLSEQITIIPERSTDVVCPSKAMRHKADVIVTYDESITTQIPYT